MFKSKVLLLLLLGLGAAWYLTRLSSSPNQEAFETLPKLTKSLLLKSESKIREQLPTEALKKDFTQWQELIKNEAQRVGRLTSYPETELIRIKQMALELPKSFLKDLALLAKNPQQSGDERLLAIELLSQSEHEEKLSVLQDVALSPIGESEVKSSLQEERAFRLSAIEGLIDKNHQTMAMGKLQELIQKTPDSQIKDYAQRALAYLQGKAPSPAEQEEKALQQILEN